MSIPKGYKLVKVTSSGVQFGNAWYSHESITGYSADQLNQGNCCVTGSAYMKWLSEKTPPQPIYDEAKRIAELEQALAGMLFAFDDGVGRDWSEDLLDFARKLTPVAEFQSRAKSVEVGDE